MKKLICLLLALLLCTPALAEVDEALLDMAQEVVSQVHELANDQNYLEATGYSEHFQYIPALAQADPAEVRSVYQINLNAMMSLMLVSGFNNMSKPAQARTKLSLINLATQWNGRKSAEALSESTILSWSRTFQRPGEFQEGSWLLDCGGALYNAMLQDTGGDAVTVTVTPMFTDAEETIETVVETLNSALFMPLIEKAQ